MTDFADQLFTDLMAEYRPTLDATELPEPRKRRTLTKPVWLTSGLATLGALITTALLVFTTGTPAYAVTQNPNGTITVTVHQLTALNAAAAALHPLGATDATGCQLSSGIATLPPSTTDTVVIDPKNIPPRSLGVLVGQSGPGGNLLVTWTLVPVGGAPACAELNVVLNWGNAGGSSGQSVPLGTGDLLPGPRPGK